VCEHGARATTFSGARAECAAGLYTSLLGPLPRPCPLRLPYRPYLTIIFS
jgi:hypothetical protein